MPLDESLLRDEPSGFDESLLRDEEGPELTSLRPVLQTEPFTISTPPESEMPGIGNWERAFSPYQPPSISAPPLLGFGERLAQRAERAVRSPEERIIEERAALGMGDMSEKAISQTVPKETARRLGVVPFGEIQAPRISAEQIEKLGVPGIVAKPAAAIEQTAAGLADFMTSAEGIMTLISGGIAGAGKASPALARLAGAAESSPELKAALEAARAGKGLERGVAAAFAADMAKHSPDQLINLTQSLASGDVKGATESFLNAAIQAAVTKHAIKGGGLNASRIREAAEVHGDVRPQPIEGQGQVPPPEGGQRVLAQAPEGIQEVQQGQPLGDITTKGSSEKAQKKEGAIPVAKEPGPVPDEAGPGLTLTPAVEAEGRVFTGMNHADAIVYAAKKGVDALDAEHKFLGSDGKFYNRKEAGAIFEKQTGQKPKFEEGLHSTELEQAGLLKHVEGTKEATPAAVTPEGPAPAVAEGEAVSNELVSNVSPVGAAVGIAPPGTAIAQAVIGRARAIGQGFARLFKSGSSRNVMDQTFDAADTQAVISGQQAAKSLGIGSSKLDREAAMAIVETGGDRARLGQFLSQSGGNERAANAVRHAENNWDRLQPLAQRTRDLLDAQIFNENNHGISTELREDYVPHLYEADVFSGAGRPFIVSGSKIPGSAFKKGRTFDTIFDAIAAGYKPKSLDVAELVEHRIRSGERLVNRKLWSEGLRQVQDPTDGTPLVTDVIRKTRGPGGAVSYDAPPGYTTREIIPGVRIAVHEGYSSYFDALTGTSRISGSLPGKIALGLAGGIKHGLLAFDTFHASRIMQRELFLTGKVAYKKGQTLLEYSDADLNRAVQENLIPQETADWVRQNRPNADLLIKNGLNVGRVQAQIAPDIIRNIKVIGPFNKWVFEKLTRGAIMQSALIELERVSQAKPNVPKEQIARDVARDLNVYFGNLGRQGVFKSRTFLDLSNLVALAPQWVESMARTEVKGAYQAAKGLTVDPILNKTILTGSIGKGFAQGLMAYFVATQLLNLFTRKKFTWDNEEKDHKLDAYIPDVTGKGPGFFISPFAVQAELAHDMIRYSHSEPTKLDAAVRIANNKSSPFLRAGKILITGKDWDRKKIIDNWERAKAAAFALAPTPIPLSTLTREQSPPGSLQKQITASLGFKTEAAPTAKQQIFNLAKDFQKTVDDPKLKHDYEKSLENEFGESDYKKLRDALNAKDEELAGKEYEALLKIKKPEQIIQAIRPFSLDRNYVRHDEPLTGNKVLEHKFVDSLSLEDLKLYDAAKAERMETWRRFQKVLQASNK